MITQTFPVCISFLTISVIYIKYAIKAYIDEEVTSDVIHHASKKTALTDAKHLSKEHVKNLRQKHYCPAVSVSYSNSNPLMIVSGSKSHLVDDKGTRYLDTRNNVAHVGHQNPHVIQAVQEQVATLNTNSRYLHPNAVLLAERLTSLIPSQKLSKVFFVNSGSEANDLALRLARAYSGSKNTIVVDCAYHGHTLGTLEVSPYKFKSGEFTLEERGDASGEEIGSGGSTPEQHIWKVPCPDMFRGVHRNDDNAGEKYAAYVKRACDFFQTRGHGEKVAAFIVEGGMSVAGVILPPKNYLKLCAEAVRSAGGLYIADEVQTGLGRLGVCNWAFQYNESSVVPDIVTLGKPFGNGMPLAAVITTQEVSDAFEGMNVEYFNTFGGNPVATAAGLAVLDALKTQSLTEHAAVVGDYLMGEFLRLKEQPEMLIGDIRGSGLFVGIELVSDGELEPATIETSFICTRLKEVHHILTSIDGPNDNVLVVKPPMVFSKENVDEFVSAFKEAVWALAQEDMQNISKTPT